jgi:hypothetical protein
MLLAHPISFADCSLNDVNVKSETWFSFCKDIVSWICTAPMHLFIWFSMYVLLQIYIVMPWRIPLEALDSNEIELFSVYRMVSPFLVRFVVYSHYRRSCLSAARCSRGEKCIIGIIAEFSIFFLIYSTLQSILGCYPFADVWVNAAQNIVILIRRSSRGNWQFRNHFYQWALVASSGTLVHVCLVIHPFIIQPAISFACYFTFLSFLQE